jgi:hypothetical protein
MVTWCGDPDPPGLGLALLVGTEPADRALAGWSPAAHVRLACASLLASAGTLPDPGPVFIPAGRLRFCEDGHDLVTWYGEAPCWCCGGPP